MYYKRREKNGRLPLEVHGGLLKFPPLGSRFTSRRSLQSLPSLVLPMIQDFLSTAIELTTLAAFLLFLLQFLRFSASHSISVQVHIAPSTPVAPPAPPIPQHPIAPAPSSLQADAFLDSQLQAINSLNAVPAALSAPISTLTADIALFSALADILSLNAVPDAICSSSTVSFTPIAPAPAPTPSRWGWTPQASSDDAALVDAHTAFSASFWAQQYNSVHVPPAARSSRSKPPRAAAKTRRTPAASIQVAATTPQLQINLSNCHTGKLRGHTYVDINDLPAPLPSGLKVYSVRGRFQGVRVDDLNAAGFLLSQ